MSGNNWATHWEQTCGDIHKVPKMRFESVAPPQTAESLPVTCAVNDAYGILLDGRVYAEEADESYIGEDFCTVEEPVVDGNGAVVNGGFRAGRRTAVLSNDTAGVDVGEGIIPPGMGQRLETLLHINRARLNARQYSWTYDSIKFNRIADDVSEAVDATRIVKFEEERKVADAVLGIGTSLASESTGDIGEPGVAMPVEIGGQEWYPYQNGVWGPAGGTEGNHNAGTQLYCPISGRYEANYANALDSNGVGMTQTLFAQLLGQRIVNRDPFTNDVIPASLQGDTIWLANDQAEIQFLSMMYQWFIAQTGLTAASTSAPGYATLYNFAKEQKLNVKKSQRWANRLTDVGLLTDTTSYGTLVTQKLTYNPLTDTFATPGSILSCFVIGRPKECIGKHLLQPFKVEDFNVPGDLQMAGYAGLRKISERSMTFYKDVPRRMSRAYA
jgi:hypothetical protein